MSENPAYNRGYCDRKDGKPYGGRSEPTTRARLEYADGWWKARDERREEREPKDKG